MQEKPNIRAVFAFASLACGLSLPSYATNGINVTSFGLESTGMAGADAGVSRDGNAVNINPAGLSRVRERAAEVAVGRVFMFNTGHEDGLGNDADIDNDRLNAVVTSYANRLSDNLVFGIGSFLQGGLGSVYESLNSPFGGRDRLELQLGVGRAAAGLAWEINPQWSVGAALSLNYAKMEQKVLPNASAFNPFDPGASFFGTDGELDGMRVGFRGGVQYRPTETVTLGLAYGAKINLPLEGDMTFNMSSIGLGRVRYSDVEIKGFSLPEEIAGGVAWQVTPDLLLAFDVSWLHWSDALESQEIVARRPGNAFAPSVLRPAEQSLDWHNQWVYALGVHYRWSERLDVYAGYNYGENPAPKRTLSPLAAPLAEKHFNMAMRYRVDKEWSAGAGIEYLLPVSVRYVNPELPFGPSKARTGYLGTSVYVVREW